MWKVHRLAALSFKDHVLLCRIIPPRWLLDEQPNIPKVLEGEFSTEDIRKHNKTGYNVYYFPNCPKEYDSSTTVNGSHIDTFECVFVDFDLKSDTRDKDAFLSEVAESAMPPAKIVDSGNGIHVYWRVSDLDAKSYLRLSRRLMRLFNTDPAVGQLLQIMRLPGTMNTKAKEDIILCEALYECDVVYTCEQLDKLLPPISAADEAHCVQHYDKTHNVRQMSAADDTMPAKFGKLCQDNHEAKSIWAGNSLDRSKDDYRLGHLMFANDFTREEATSVLVNSAKAASRAPIHRLSYAQNIVDKIWTYEIDGSLDLSDSIENILKKSGHVLKGTPFRCHKRIDNTVHGFRLGQVLGLVAGSGIGKTAFAMNMFRWFAQENPDYHNFFVPLEQPANEIADRWQTMCGTDTALHSKVHVMSNYDDEGNFRHLSLEEIKQYLIRWQAETKQKIGCVVIDHIGALKKKGSNDENQDLMTICHSMKSFAVQTNTFLIMQSQTSREKAGIGDLELNKDAAYGTLFFEAYCDWLVTLWQPLKRCHKEESCPTVTAFKYCKIRHKKAKRDIIKEDEPYFLYFDSETELMRDMTQDEEVSFSFFLPKATNKRKADRKTDIIEYKSVPYKGQDDTATNRH